jgi:ATP synthase protein I
LPAAPVPPFRPRSRLSIVTESDHPETPQNHADKMRAARASAIGIQFGISIAIGALAGNWLDQKFGTAPWLLVVGLLIGAAAGFRDLWVLAKSQMSDEEEEQ